MNTNLIDLIDAFEDKKIIVIGDAMLDTYLIGSTDRLCREAPVPIVAVHEHKHVPGGAANTAVNLRSLGGEVMFLSAVGTDKEGETLLTTLKDLGVSTKHIQTDSSRITLAKQRVMSDAQILLRFDQGYAQPLPPATETALIRDLRNCFPGSDAVLISDYGYGILTGRVRDTLAELQAQHPRLLVVDSKYLTLYKDMSPTVVKPNYAEAAQLLGLDRAAKDSERSHQIEQNGRRILELTGAQIAAVTVDREGSLIFQQDEDTSYHTYARPQPSSHTTGAGDTYTSVLTLALAAGASIESAAELASASASVVVSKNGTAVCHADELRAQLLGNEKLVTDIFQLVARIAAHQRSGQRVVFTNGCFDILHSGHIAYLNRAKALGDVLIVGLNSDDSVRRLKGPNRPINSLDERAQILAALSCIDYIIPFESDTPHELIRAIRPNIFVKGGDYTRENLPEAELVESLGGELRILPYLENHSTTSIIEKIRRLYVNIPSKV